MRTINEIKALLNRCNLKIFGKEFTIRVEHDNLFENGRIFIQIQYEDECRITKKSQIWSGRKWYLSEYMLNDEIIKTCYAAFKATVEHEIMEGFTVDNIVLFNPHINFEELLKITNNEVKRNG